MPKQLTTSPGPQRQISLLFDVFVLNQRLRALLSQALAGTGMRPDEYRAAAWAEIGRASCRERVLPTV